MAAYDTYAEKAGRNEASSEQLQVQGKPVFIKHRDIPCESEFYTENMYKALVRAIPSREIHGIQKIRGLWRLYIENKKKSYRTYFAGAESEKCVCRCLRH